MQTHASIKEYYCLLFRICCSGKEANTLYKYKYVYIMKYFVVCAIMIIISKSLQISVLPSIITTYRLNNYYNSIGSPLIRYGRHKRVS